MQGELGAGAMAMVYRAVDRKHRRPVAIKVLRAEQAAVHGAERFLLEIGLTARLSHPHILPLLDSGSAVGLPFYVMPLVHGESLRALLEREQRLATVDALRLANQIADALAYAHAQGVLHRDIKPDNILISGKHALVADFGIAKALQAAASDIHQTHVGQVVGTPAYMSPEQAAGDEMDGRSDVYSLAAVLYEMVVGEPVWRGGTVQATIARRFTEDPPSAQSRRADVPPALDATLRKGLARLPNERFASAAEFADALAAVQVAVAVGGSQISVPVADALPVASVAVLPFESLSSDPDNVFLSDGITEDILTSLARLPTVRVCARSSCFALKGQAVDARTAGERLGVRNIVTGSVRRAGNRLRVTAELVDVSDGFRRWTERYDRTLDDVFAIQDEISSAIVTALNARFGDRRMSPAASSTGVVAAYESMLKGRELLNRRTESTTYDAVTTFERAVQLDPRYATAYAGLADSWAMLGVYGARAPNEAMPEAARRADEALALAPELAEPRATLGLVQSVYHWNWQAADEAYRQAIAASPSYATAHQWHATTVLVPLGRFEEALQATTRAMRLDPLSLAAKATLSAVLLYAQRYHEAIDAARQAISVDSGFAPAYFFLGQALAQLGDYEGAVEAAERAAELSGRSSENLALLGYVLGRANHSSRAAEILQTLHELSEHRYVAPTQLALVQLGLDRAGPALDDLTRAVQARSADLIWLGARPAWRPLHGYQRFRDMLGRIGVSAVS
ncbi:MAG TPA: protein kinase [Gemmatimonadaceae bacterium]|nr:protein kinase [Gemmatimonadaceae bacterium]